MKKGTIELSEEVPKILLLEHHHRTGKLVEAIFEEMNIRASTNRLRSSLNLSASLKGIQLVDKFAEKTKFFQIFPNLMVPLYDQKSSSDEQYFLRLDYQKHPPQSDYDYIVKLNTLPLQIVFDQRCFSRVVKFFDLGKNSDTTSDLETMAIERLKFIRDKTMKKITQQKVLLDFKISV